VAERGRSVAADYQIYVRGRLGPEVQHALADLRPQPRSNCTLLSAEGIDQAALYGILDRLRSLALEVDSLWRTDARTTG